MAEQQKLRALITGASAGLGAVFAERLAERGYDLILVARRADRLRELAQRLQEKNSVDVEVFSADLADPSDLTRVEQYIQDLPSLDLLINNAGFGYTGTVAEQEPDKVENMLHLNIIALVRLTQATLPGMLARSQGTIINVSSGTAFMQMAGIAAYSASKSFVLTFTEALHAEVGERGIKVQVLCPGVIRTEFHEVAGNDLSRFPAQIVMSAEDVTDASLAGLELGEVVCIPSLPDIGDWNRYAEARGAVAQSASRDHPADRYQVSKA